MAQNHNNLEFYQYFMSLQEYFCHFLFSTCCTGQYLWEEGPLGWNIMESRGDTETEKLLVCYGSKQHK